MANRYPWLRRLFSWLNAPTKIIRKKPSHGWRLQVEALEDRVVPAQFDIQGAGIAILNLDTPDSVSVVVGAADTVFTLQAGGTWTQVGGAPIANAANVLTIANASYLNSFTLLNTLSNPASSNNQVIFNTGAAALTSAAITVTLADPGADNVIFNGGLLSSAGTVSISTTNGVISSPNGVGIDITANRANLSTNTGVGPGGNTVTTSVAILEAVGGTGDISIANTGSAFSPDLTIGGTGGLTGVSSGPGAAITITNVGGAGTGNLIVAEAVTAGLNINISTVDADAAASVLFDVNAAISTTSGGDIVLTSDNDTSIDAAVSVSGGAGSIQILSNSTDGIGDFTSSGIGGIISTTGGSVSIGTTLPNSFVTANVGGTITVTGGIGSIQVQAEDAIIIDAPLLITNATGAIVLRADDDDDAVGDLTTNVSGTLNTEGGDITGNGANITVGGAISSTVGGNILLDNTSSNADGDIAVNALITASGGNGTITITSDDDVSITAAVSAAGTGTITVLADQNTDSSGNLTTSGAVTTATGNISLTADSTVSIGANVQVLGGTGSISIFADPTTTIPPAANAASGNFTSNAAGTIQTANGNISIQAADNINLGGAITAGGTGSVTLFADAAFDDVGDAAINATITTTNGNVAIIADDTDITAAITTGALNQVFLFNRDPADLITLGTDTVDALGLTQADLNFITTGILNIGGDVEAIIPGQVGIGNQTGNISITAPITLLAANVPVLSLETTVAGGILDNVAGEASPILTVRDLALRTGAGIGSADDLDVSVSNLAASNSTTGDILIQNTGVATLTIAPNIDAITVGVTNGAAGGDINISTVGALNINAWVFANAGGDNDITLTTSGANAGITKTATGLVNAVGGTGDILLDTSAATSGGSMTFTRNNPFFDIFASGAGNITLLANDGITLNDDASGVLFQAATGNITIRSNVTDVNGTADITVGLNASIRTDGDITLDADPDANNVGGAITLGNSTLAGSSGSLATNITLHAATNITLGTLSASTLVTAISETGGIIDGNDPVTGTNNITAPTAILQAATGIGSAFITGATSADAPIEVTVANLAFTNTTSGNVQFVSLAAAVTVAGTNSAPGGQVVGSVSGGGTLAVGTVNAVPGIDTNGGSVILDAFAGLNVTQTINTQPGAGGQVVTGPNVTPQAPDALYVAGAGDIRLNTNNFLDNFNRADSGTLGAQWTTQTGTWAISTNTAAASATDVSIATVNSLTFTDVVVQADILNALPADSRAGLIARYSGTGEANASFYLGMIYNNPANGKYEAYIFRKSPASFVQLGTTADLTGFFTGTGSLRFEVVGNQLKLFVNNLLQIVAYDTAISATGLVGLRGKASQADNFNAAAITVPSTTLPYTDTFTKPNNSPLDRVWIERKGTFLVQGNAASAAGNITTDVSIATLNHTAVADVIVQANVNMLNVNAARVGLMARYTGPDEKNFYLGMIFNNGGVFEAYIFVNVNGTFTQLAFKNLTGAFTGVGNIRFEVIGNQLKFFVNDILQAVANDATITTPGLVGMRNISSSMDDFQATLSPPLITTTPFLDTFTKPDNSVLDRVWTERVGAYTIQNNTAVATDLIPGVSIATLNTVALAPSDTTANVVVANANGARAGLIARYSGPDEKNFYLGMIYNNNGVYEAYIFLNLNGVFTQLGFKNLTGIFTGVGSMRFQLAGPTLNFYVNGALQITANDLTLASGQVGMRNANARLDDFNVS